MKIKAFFLTLLCSSTAWAAVPNNNYPPVLTPLPQYSQAANLSAQILTESHYKTMPLNDTMSEKIFDNYLKALDGNRMFFTQSDIQDLAITRHKLDDAILNRNLSSPYVIFSLYQRRIIEHLNFSRELLKIGFDLNQKENFQYDRSKSPWPKDTKEMHDLWRKKVKNDWLLLKLAGQKDKAIRERLDKRYSNSLNYAYKSTSEDVFQAFMNAYSTAIDPHTNYLAPKSMDNFNISMKLSLVGIGATLQVKDEYTTIRELVPGSPAALSGKLSPGDRIVGVGQGANSSPTDVIGWRIDDVVSLIRGEKGTVVLLDILPAGANSDAKHKTVTLVRDKINLEQQAAKKSVIKTGTGDTTRSVGIITLPTFYRDFEARNNGEREFKSATRDVANLIEELKKEKVDSILLDLRNNGGGALSEAIELTGLFIKKGPVVMQRNSEGDVNVEKDNNAAIAWEGPLGVLINHSSASASEIVAAAIQDYGRGIIIGEHSFGKGTVQTLINLDEFANNRKAPLGELKMTTAQFFRINGGTTQLRGVIPDIRLPGMAEVEEYGEASYENALPWTQIKPASFKPEGNLKPIIPHLQSHHATRVAKNKEFQYLVEDINELKEERKKNQISLNEAERRKQREQQDARQKARKGSKSTPDAALDEANDDGLLSNERDLSNELAAEKAKKNAKDVILEEAAHILADASILIKNDSKMAASQR